MGASSPEKFDIEESLARYGHSADRAPPCERRPNGAELWWAAVRNFYRSASATERRGKGGASILLGRANRDEGREAACFVSHTNDFAVDVADRNYDFLTMVDVDLVTAAKKWGARNDAM